LAVVGSVGVVGFVVLVLPDVAASLLAVCREVILLAGALVSVAVVVWGVVEDEQWSLREAIRMVSALALVVPFLAAVALVVLSRAAR
jgi:uncharacterized BrkB/YihY/UPF0761 family membrane protein